VDNTISPGFFTRRKYLSPQVDAFVAISGAIKKMLLEYGVPPEKVHLVRSAVGDSGVKRTHVERDYVVIGNASALTSQKGHDYLIQACRILADKKLNFRCRIAGDGPDEAMLSDLIKDLKLESFVELVGRVQDVPQFLSDLDVLCVPSRNEGLGTILLEGVFAGCALVGASVGGISEIIHDHETGLLVPPHNVPALARALEEVITKSDLRARLVLSAKAHVEAHFSLNAMVQGNIAVYKSLLTSGRN
jgi:glycosyltransferase involved in cell wall biosynthesis